MNNQFGLDADYFKKNLEILARDIEHYRPEELYRALNRLSAVAFNEGKAHEARCIVEDYKN